jgi:hypothetical protein
MIGRTAPARALHCEIPVSNLSTGDPTSETVLVYLIAIIDNGSAVCTYTIYTSKLLLVYVHFLK